MQNQVFSKLLYACLFHSTAPISLDNFPVTVIVEIHYLRLCMQAMGQQMSHSA